MTRLGIAIEETWSFFNEIYADLENYYQTSLFARREFRLPFFYTRVNRFIFHHDLQNFMKMNDVVFFEWASELLAEATNLRKTCGIITRLHRYEMYQWVDRINWDAVDRVILVSKAMQAEFIERFPDQAEKTIVAPPSTSLDKFNFVQKTYHGDIGILCHLTPRKRVYDLILTFYELLQNNSDFHLHIAGGKHPAHEDYYRALHNIVEDLNLQNNVTFYGHLSDPSNWYAKIDIFISNSYSEGLQVAPMEAMASGCYCLSHRWRGAAELLPENYLFTSGKELQEKIIAYSLVPETIKNEQRTFMRQIACQEFDIKKTSQQIRSVIDEVGSNANQ